jgi:hypothetical protein
MIIITFFYSILLYMYLIVILVTVILFILFFVFYARKTGEQFQSEIVSPNNDLSKMARLYNVQYSANIPGVNSDDIYETANKCLKYEAYKSCSSNERAQYNDLDCNQAIMPGMNGICKCTKGDVMLTCDESRDPTNCERACNEKTKVKSLEFNGNDSRVDMELLYNNQNGFTLSFYIKLNDFKRFPYQPQMVLLAKDPVDNKPAFMIYINENRKVCVYSYNSELNYIDDQELETTQWYNISFGNIKENQFIQINDKRKTFTGMKLDLEESETTRKILHFGSLPNADEQQYLSLKALLGNITINPKFMSQTEICQNNKYCGALEPEFEANTESRCMFNPEGSNVVSCIRKCKDNMLTNQCNIEECIDKCENCEDLENCPYKKPPTVYSDVKQPQQEVVENPEKCEFKPWGVNENHCVSECSEGANRDQYGGSLCNKQACATICKSCENIRFCPWLVPSKQDVNTARSPDAPRNLVGLPANNSALIMWTRPNNNNSEIIGYKVLYYKANEPDSGLQMRNISQEQIKSPLKYSLTGLDNGVVYNIGVVAINARGASQLSNVISVKPAGTIQEGFQNPEPISQEKECNCDLFNQLRGKKIEISF